MTLPTDNKIDFHNIPFSESNVIMVNVSDSDIVLYPVLYSDNSEWVRKHEKEITPDPVLVPSGNVSYVPNVTINWFIEPNPSISVNLNIIDRMLNLKDYQIVWYAIEYSGE